MDTLSGTPLYNDKRHGYVFWHHEGERYRNVASRFAAMRATLEDVEPIEIVVDFNLHDLRHLFAVMYLRAGGSIYKLQKLLGHKRISTTELYLEHMTTEEAERAKNGPFHDPLPGTEWAQNWAHVQTVFEQKEARFGVEKRGKKLVA